MRVELRPVVESDLPILHAQQCDPEAVAAANFPARPYEVFLAAFGRDPAGVKRVIVVEGEVAGCVSLFHVEGEPNVGYQVGRRFWGRGIASAALSAFLRDPATQRPLYARTWVHNARSVRVLEKAGFTRRDVPTPEDELAFELR